MKTIATTCVLLYILLGNIAVAEVISQGSESVSTAEHNAWEQYEHMARWLIYLGTMLEIENTSIEEEYLAATLRSMKTMSKSLTIGYSWHAYKSWKSRWPSIISSNRALIKKYITEKTDDSDALSIVNSM